MEEVERIKLSLERSLPGAKITVDEPADPLKSSTVTCEYMRRAVMLRIAGASGVGVRDLKLDLCEEIFVGASMAVMRALAILRS